MKLIRYFSFLLLYSVNSEITTEIRKVGDYAYAMSSLLVSIVISSFYSYGW